MNAAWIRAKVAAYRAGWRRVHRAEPSDHNAALGVGMAWHETRCGDAWPGPDGVLCTADDERNWGACTLRALSALESQAIKMAGITPTVGKGHEGRAKAAQAALVAAGFPLATGTILGQFVKRSAIHCDSAPERGPYFTWFACFDSDAEGAEYFVRLLTLKRDLKTFKSAKSVLENEHSTAHDLAAAAYAAGYYTGFHKRDEMYTRPDGSQAIGADMNIEAYAARIRPKAAQILAVLGTPPETTPLVQNVVQTRPQIGLGATGPEVVAWQRFLINAGVLVGDADGEFGPVTSRATKAFQGSRGLVADGVVGPKTWAEAGRQAVKV